MLRELDRLGQEMNHFGLGDPFFPTSFLNFQTSKLCFTKWLQRQSKAVNGAPQEFVQEDTKLLWKI